MINLCSMSKSRAKILNEFNYKFKQFESGFDEESITTNDPIEFAYSAVVGKFNSSLNIVNDNIVVADSVVSVNSIMFRKPKDIIEAKNMLDEEIKYGFSVVTAMIIACGEFKFIDINITDITMSSFDTNSYLNSGEWRGKAGAIMIENSDISKHILKINGSTTGARGLSIEKLRMIYK